MNNNLILFSVASLLLGAFFSAFILLFGKKKSFNSRNSFVLVGLFFLAGIILLVFSLSLIE